MVEVVKQDKWYDARECANNADTLYVFGDNTQEVGCGGQAVIRYLPNSIGIPTKSKPTMEEDAFFDDSVVQFLKVEQAICNILKEMLSGKYSKVVFPGDGLGTGLAMMEEKSPILFDNMNIRIYECFGVDYGIPANIKKNLS